MIALGSETLAIDRKHQVDGYDGARVALDRLLCKRSSIDQLHKDYDLSRKLAKLGRSTTTTTTLATGDQPPVTSGGEPQLKDGGLISSSKHHPFSRSCPSTTEGVRGLVHPPAPEPRQPSNAPEAAATVASAPVAPTTATYLDTSERNTAPAGPAELRGSVDIAAQKEAVGSSTAPILRAFGTGPVAPTISSAAPGRLPGLHSLAAPFGSGLARKEACAAAGWKGPVGFSSLSANLAPRSGAGFPGVGYRGTVAPGPAVSFLPPAVGTGTAGPRFAPTSAGASNRAAAPMTGIPAQQDGRPGLVPTVPAPSRPAAAWQKAAAVAPPSGVPLKAPCGNPSTRPLPRGRGSPDFRARVCAQGSCCRGPGSDGDSDTGSDIDSGNASEGSGSQVESGNTSGVGHDSGESEAETNTGAKGGDSGYVPSGYESGADSDNESLCSRGSGAGAACSSIGVTAEDDEVQGAEGEEASDAASGGLSHGGSAVTTVSAAPAAAGVARSASDTDTVVPVSATHPQPYNPGHLPTRPRGRNGAPWMMSARSDRCLCFSRTAARAIWPALMATNPEGRLPVSIHLADGGDGSVAAAAADGQCRHSAMQVYLRRNRDCRMSLRGFRRWPLLPGTSWDTPLQISPCPCGEGALIELAHAVTLERHKLQTQRLLGVKQGGSTAAATVQPPAPGAAPAAADGTAAGSSEQPVGAAGAAQDIKAEAKATGATGAAPEQVQGGVDEASGLVLRVKLNTRSFCSNSFINLPGVAALRFFDHLLPPEQHVMAKNETAAGSGFPEVPGLSSAGGAANTNVTAPYARSTLGFRSRNSFANVPSYTTRVTLIPEAWPASRCQADLRYRFPELLGMLPSACRSRISLGSAAVAPLVLYGGQPGDVLELWRMPGGTPSQFLCRVLRGDGRGPRGPPVPHAGAPAVGATAGAGGC